MQLDPKSGGEIPFKQPLPMHLQNPGGGESGIAGGFELIKEFQFGK